jgi:4-amino-4-deoxy-L-arabinose transferase-like glycosyltransferase
VTQGSPRARTGAPPTWLLIFIAAITLARLAAAAVIPLTEDEAYYRLWSHALQFGYYDHPPMIAWWIRAGVSLAGDGALGVRLLPSLAGAATSLLVFDLGRRMDASVATAARGAVWYNATLLAAFGGTLAVPDAAATPFFVATLCCLARTDQDRQAGAWWLAAGVMAGLACLSKYSALFLAPGVILWLVLTPSGLARLRRPAPWGAAFIAAAIFSLNIAWNAEHHWLTFAKQFGRIAPHALKPGYLAEFLIGQFLLLNPIIAVFAIRALSGPDRRSMASALPVAAGLPFVAYLLLHALHDRVQAHWPAPIYPGLALVAAIAAENAEGGLARLRRIAAPLGVGLGALGLVHLALPATDLPRIADPVSAVRGWPAFTQKVDALASARGARWIGTMSYGVASQLAANGVKAPVVQVTERDRYPPGDASWTADMTRPGLIVDLDRRMNAAQLGACFALVRPLGEVDRGDGRTPPEHYRAVLVAQPRGDVLKFGCPTPPRAP